MGVSNRGESHETKDALALLVALMVLAMTLGMSAALAGGMTGNGRPLRTARDFDGEHHTIHHDPFCASSGQNGGFHSEDLVEFTGDERNRVPTSGRIPKQDRKGTAPRGGHAGEVRSANGAFEEQRRNIRDQMTDCDTHPVAHA